MEQARNLGKRSGRPSYQKVDGIAAERFLREAGKIVISRQEDKPLWKQLYDQLENLIYSGKIAEGSRIPSEPALCDLFGVSRPVVRNAIGSLASKGLVVKIARKGMFVGRPPRDSGFVTTNLSLYDDMLARGANIRTKTYELVKAEPDDKEREALELAEGDKVIRIRRVFWVDDIAITYTRMSFPASKLPGFEHESIEGHSILKMVHDLYGRSAARAERWFKAAMPSPTAQERMNVPADHPLIWIESIAFEKDGTPLELYCAYYNSDAARIHVSVSD